MLPCSLLPWTPRLLLGILHSNPPFRAETTLRSHHLSLRTTLGKPWTTNNLSHLTSLNSLTHAVSSSTTLIRPNYFYSQRPLRFLPTCGGVVRYGASWTKKEHILSFNMNVSHYLMHLQIHPSLLTAWTCRFKLGYWLVDLVGNRTI